MNIRHRILIGGHGIPLSILVATARLSEGAKPAEAVQPVTEHQPVPSPVPVMNRAERRREKRRMKK